MLNNHFIKVPCSEFPADHQFNGIDIAKFLCAFLVCMVHISPFHPELLGTERSDQLNFWLQQCLCRIAVPFYFAAAGFLLFRKPDFQNPDQNRIKTYCFRILRLLGTWMLLLFAGIKTHLWYLSALVLAVLVLNFLLKKGIPLPYLVILSVLLYVIGVSGDSYYAFLEPLKAYTIPRILIIRYDAFFSTTRNGLFFGVIFVLMGALFAKKRIVMNYMLAMIGFLASLALLFLEVYRLKHFSHPKDYNMVLSLVPVTFFLFYLVTHISLKNRPIYGRLRIIGMLIFLSHRLVYFCVMFGIEDAKRLLRIDLTAHQFIITVFLTTMLAVLIERLSKTKKLYWLKYLYS